MIDSCGSGVVINGAYRLTRELSVGERARVYEGERIADGRSVVVKSCVASADAVAEGRRMRSVRHPSIVEVLDVGRVETLEGEMRGVDAGSAFVVTAHVAGEDLEDFVPPGGEGGPAAFAVELFAQLLEALSHLHRRGVVHRDVHPGNVRVSCDAAGAVRITLLDFDLAVPAGSVGTSAGRFGFIAPEQLLGRSGPAGDLWSAAATVRWFLTRRDPFAVPGEREPDRAVRLTRLLRSEPRTVALDAGGLPERAIRVIDGCLRRDPADRPFSAVAALAGLDPDRARGAVPPDPGLFEAPFVGRAESSAALAAAFASCGREGGTIVVAGPEGSGRRRLVSEGVAGWIERAMAEGEPAPRVDRVVERGDGAGEADVSRGLSARSAGPRVVVVDATALSSDAAADHVARLSAGVRAARVAAGGAGTAFPACVVAVVPAPARPVTAEAIRIDLPPLSEVEAARLLRSVLVEPPAAAVVSLLHRVAEGWPGRLLAEAAARFPDGRPRIGGESAGAPSPLDPGLLPPADRDLLVRLALEPFPVSAVDLVDPEAGEAAEEEAALSFRRLARFGWVVRDGDAAAVREPTRESLRAALDDRERRSIHRRLAGRATGLRRAYHRIAAADGDDLARVLREESAALATPTEADRTALLAWAYDRDPSALAPGEELALARGAVTEGRYDLAARLLGSGRGPGGGARSVVRAAWLRRTGRVGEAARLLESAVRRGGEAAAAARLDLADLALSRGDLEEAARRLARVDPAPAGLAARAAELRIRAALARGDLAEADREASDAAEGAETGHRLWSLRGAVHLRRGRFDAAIAAFERSAEAARSAGDRHGAAADAANLGSAMLEAGRVVEAVQRLRGAVVELSALGARRELPAALLNLANAHVRIGDGEGALRILAHLREATPARLWDGFEAWVAAIEADARRLLGDDRGASERLDRVLDAPSAERPGDALLAGFLRLERADLAVRAGDVATARRRVAEVPEGSGAWPLRVRRATVALRIETLEGVPSAGAAEALVRGLADWPSPRDRLVEWRALAALAGAARRAGRGPAARAAALRAAAAAKAYRREVEEMGFDPLAGDPEQRLVDGILAETAGPGGAGGGVAGAPEVRRLLAVQRRLSSERDPARLLDVILDALVEITGAERGLLLIRPRRGEGLVVRRFRNVAAGALAARDGGSISLSIAEQVARTGEPIVTLDARADDRFAASRSVHDLGLRTVMVLPLIARGRTLGVVYLDTRMREAPIPPGVQDAALDLAGQAAMALQTARLLRLLRRHRREIERLNRELQRRVEEQAVELRGLRETLEETLPPEVADPFPGIVGGSAAMRDLHHRMRRVADADLGVLILGESGTGKELVARALHRRGGRREGPFVTENCAAIPESLLESILFGHVRGAFTGADRDRPGLFVVADRGTLFLDEIGDMSLSLQSKLLRVLEDGEVRPVGGSVVRRVDVRILAASNRDLAAMVRDGTFREDLFYRLAVLTLRLPPLRERVEDVPALVAHFLRKHAPDRRVAFSPAALRRIASLPWPGNVRQLENVVVRTLVLADGDLIDAGDLDIEGGAAAARPDPDLAPDGNLDIRTHVEALERRLIARALEASGGNRTRAAALLGLSRFGLLKKLRRGEE